MKPVKFPEQNRTFVGPKGGAIAPLQVYQDRNAIISCWKLSWRDVLSAIFFRHIWLSVAGSKLPPLQIRCMKTAFPRRPWLTRCRRCVGNGFVSYMRRYKDNGMNMVPRCSYCDASGLNVLGRFMAAHPALEWSSWKWGLYGIGFGLAAFLVAIV